METQNDSNATFNGQNEQQGIKQAMQDERSATKGKLNTTDNEMSLGDSERNFGEVSGTTFGDQSNPAKFSHIGGNQSEQGEGNSSTGSAG